MNALSELCVSIEVVQAFEHAFLAGDIEVQSKIAGDALIYGGAAGQASLAANAQLLRCVSPQVIRALFHAGGFRFMQEELHTRIQRVVDTFLALADQWTCALQARSVAAAALLRKCISVGCWRRAREQALPIVQEQAAYA